MNKLVLAATILTASAISVYAGDPQGPETLDTGSLGEYFDPDLGTFSTTPPPPADIPSEDDDYAAVFADVTRSATGATTYGEEWLIPYNPNGSLLEFSMINDTEDTFTITNAGFELSTSPISLDDLSDTTLPSGFTQLDDLDNVQLSPGGTTVAAPLPEPSSVWLAGIATAAFCLVRRNLRQAV